MLKMALHISETAVLESIFTEHWEYHHKKIVWVERSIIRQSWFPLKTKQTSICCTSFIKVFFMFWLLVIISESVMHPFFLSRNMSEWRANEMSENGLKMACDLRLCLHINIVHSRRNQRQDSWLAHISPLKYKIPKGHFCRLQNYGYSLRGYDK